MKKMAIAVVTMMTLGSATAHAGFGSLSNLYHQS